MCPSHWPPFCLRQRTPTGRSPQDCWPPIGDPENPVSIRYPRRYLFAVWRLYDCSLTAIYIHRDSSAHRGHGGNVTRSPTPSFLRPVLSCPSRSRLTETIPDTGPGVACASQGRMQPQRGQIRHTATALTWEGCHSSGERDLRSSEKAKRSRRFLDRWLDYATGRPFRSSLGSVLSSSWRSTPSLPRPHRR